MHDLTFLITPVCAWFAAQFIKYIVSLRKDGFSVSDFTASGGFPSSHAAFVTSLTTIVGLSYGVNSTYFAICIVFSGIILYDTVGVRRTVGDQTDAIKLIVKTQHLKIHKKIHTSRGHTIIEMIAGGLLGVLVGLFNYYVF
jgi:acid phosphatase family membrane protein YuiD